MSADRGEFESLLFPASRRTLLKSAAAAAVMIGRPWVARAKPAQLVIPNFGGALDEAFKAAYFDTFTAKTGIPIVSTSYVDVSKLKAMVESNSVDVDILNMGPYDAAIAAKAGLLEPIDYSVVKKDDLIPEACKEYYVLSNISALVIGWNTKSLTPETRPKNWADVFDPKKTNRRAFYKNPISTLEVAALAGGQPKEKLYPIELDLAFSKLDGIKDRISWYESGAQQIQLVVSAEADMALLWNGRVDAPKKNGDPIDFTFDHCIFDADSMMIPKGGKNKTESMQFLQHMMQAENQAVFAQHISYGPVNRKAYTLLDEATKSKLPTDPRNIAAGDAWENYDYWAQNIGPISDRFNRWLIG
jgi:putative spermidine/putrescine transport system substrate-binding protein